MPLTLAYRWPYSCNRPSSLCKLQQRSAGSQPYSNMLRFATFPLFFNLLFCDNLYKEVEELSAGPLKNWVAKSFKSKDLNLIDYLLCVFAVSNSVWNTRGGRGKPRPPPANCRRNQGIEYSWVYQYKKNYASLVAIFCLINLHLPKEEFKTMSMLGRNYQLSVYDGCGNKWLYWVRSGVCTTWY